MVLKPLNILDPIRNMHVIFRYPHAAYPVHYLPLDSNNVSKSICITHSDNASDFLTLLEF